MLDVSLIGTGGMMPLHNRHLTAMLVRYKGSMLLVDCGEGTQVTMRQLGWGFANLDYVLITHFHADHVSGIPGLLLSLSNYGRTAPLTIVGLKGIKRIINSLRVIAPGLLFPIEFVELEFGTSTGAVDIPPTKKNSCDNRLSQEICLGDFNIRALLLEHSTACAGYSLSFKRGGKFDVERAREQNIPLKLWSVLQSGKAVDGFTPDMVLGAPRKGLKISYITDSRPIAAIPEFIKNSDLLICEGLYGDDDMKEKANGFSHMIFSDAARLAKAGNVKEMWLTHYSPAFKEPQSHIKSATTIFKNAKAAYDRMTTTLLFEELEHI
ncbi:MAG: ribonuclease Z [Oscillospiraceae bacterium]|nr:ribonuclease Z [Oscillospiraceae bacterium]